MGNIAKTYTMVNGQPADATQVNKNFDDIIAGVGDTADLHPTIASLGLDADLVTLALPANTTISAAGAELINDADATAQRATLGGVVVGPVSATDNAIVRFDAATGKLVQNSSVLIDDAGFVGMGATPSGAYRLNVQGSIFGNGIATDGDIYAGGNISALSLTAGGQVTVVNNDARLSDARLASDVSAWAKAGSKPSYTAAEVGTKKITTGSVTLNPSGTTVTHGLGTTPTLVLVFTPAGGALFGSGTWTSTTFTIESYPAQAVIWIAFA